MPSVHISKGIKFFVRDGRHGVWDRSVIDEVVGRDCYRIGGWIPKNPVVVLDVGGYIGAFSKWVGLRVPAAKIIAFEPVAANFALLKMNTSDVPNVTVVHAAVGDRKGNVSFIENTDNPAGGGVSWGAVGGTTSCIDISDVISDAGGYVDCLKLDCEGGEFPILDKIVSLPGGVRAHVGCIRGEIHAPVGGPQYKKFMGILRSSFPFTIEQPLAPKLSLVFAWR